MAPATEPVQQGLSVASVLLAVAWILLLVALITDTIYMYFSSHASIFHGVPVFAVDEDDEADL